MEKTFVYFSFLWTQWHRGNDERKFTLDFQIQKRSIRAWGYQKSRNCREMCQQGRRNREENQTSVFAMNSWMSLGWAYMGRDFKRNTREQLLPGWKQKQDIRDQCNSGIHLNSLPVRRRMALDTPGTS